MIQRDIILTAGGYVAEISSRLGGACLRLKNEALGIEILNTPPTEEAYFENVCLFGNPILFPPNRTRGGEFSFLGRTYRLPINEPATGSHLHGELHKTPFSVELVGDDRAVLKFSAAQGEYLDFPHAFEITRDYRLSESGLVEMTTARNLSEEPMPFTLAYHTTFDLRDLGRGATLSLPVTREQMRDEKYLPTLEWCSGRERDLAIARGEYGIYSAPISALYKTEGRIGRITDPVSRKSIICDCSEHFGYRMLWRREGADFLCIEPQTSAIDLFHLDLPPEEYGLRIIEPHGSLTLTVRYAAEIFD